MATHESHQNALRQRDALALEVLKLRTQIEELRKPDAALDLAALVAEIGLLRSEIARLKAPASDNPQGFRQPAAETLEADGISRCIGCATGVSHDHPPKATRTPTPGLYPAGWPLCRCGDWCMDGKATCGRVECL